MPPKVFENQGQQFIFSSNFSVKFPILQSGGSPEAPPHGDPPLLSWAKGQQLPLKTLGKLLEQEMTLRDLLQCSRQVTFYVQYNFDV